jgi:hypothetical protein
MNGWRLLAVAMTAAIWVSCGGGDSPSAPSAPSGSPSAPVGSSGGSNQTNNGNVTAVIDGVPWNGLASIVMRNDVLVSISGYLPPLATSPSYLVIVFPPSTGTHAIGAVNVTSVQYNLNIVPSPLWQARTAGTGSITVATLSGTSTTGTFAVSATPMSAAASGIKMITGSFDVRF